MKSWPNDIIELTKKYSIIQLNSSQFRVQGFIDLYTASKKFHVIGGMEKGKRGVYVKASEIVEKLLKQGRLY